MLARKFFAVFAILLVFLTAFGAGYDYRGDDAELCEYINELCEGYGLPPELIYAVIERESSWRADALNAAGNCIGLMQISTVNLGWLGESLGVQDLYDPYENVLAGISMLASYVESYQDYHMALMCYNCGCGGAQKLFDQGIYSSTYSRWVVERMEALDAASYPLITDTQPQSGSSQDMNAAADAGSDPDEAPRAEDVQEDPPEGDPPQMLSFEQEPVRALPQQDDVPPPGAPETPDSTSAADAVAEEMKEESPPVGVDNRFTVIHARDDSQEDPTRPVCAAVSAK